MISNDLAIGPAPDFLLKSGSISIYHSASVSVMREQVTMQRFNFSHRSFVNFINEMTQRMVALRWSRDIDLNWRDDELLSSTFRSSMGLVVIQYRIHPALSGLQKSAISHEFRKRISKNLLEDENLPGFLK